MSHYFGVQVLDGKWHSLLPRYLVLSDRIRNRRVLDLGCGSGIGASLLLELGAERVDGVDHPPERIDLARTKHDKASLDFHCMRWGDMGFPDDTFDVVLCLDPSRSVTEPELLGEIRRVLKGDGEYICSIERRTIEGLDSLLPRQHTDASVASSSHEEQAPQIGELTHYFETLNRLRQRPTYDYTFEPEPLWERHADEAIPPPREDDTLCPDEPVDAGVELLFCGPDSAPPPPHRAIRLPYYRLVERLHELADSSPEPRESVTSRTDERPSTDRAETVEPPREPGDDVRQLEEAFRATRRRLERIQHESQALTRDRTRLFEALASALEGIDRPSPRPRDRASTPTHAPSSPEAVPPTSERHETNAYDSVPRHEDSTSTLAEETNEPELADESNDGDDHDTAVASDPEDDAEDSDALTDELARLQSQQEQLRAELEERASYIEELQARVENESETALDEETETSDDDETSDATDTSDPAHDESPKADEEHATTADSSSDETSSPTP